MNNTDRQWLTYEKNWLIKHGFSLDDLDQYGQEPVEYITGWAPFYRRRFKVSPAVLIPRPETEQLVEIILNQLKLKGDLGQTEPLKLIEVGTGSGVIALTLILELEKQGNVVDVTASDISSESLKLAQKNADLWLEKEQPNKYQYGQSSLVLKQSDLLAEFSNESKPDLIAANLPYIPSKYMEQLPQSVSRFEPKTALDGGKNGLKFIRQLLIQAQKIYQPLPTMVFEIDHRSNIDCKTLGIEDTPYKMIKDYRGKNRFLLINYSGKIV